LNRLYNETLVLKQSIGELHESIADLRGVAEAHQRIVEAHQSIVVKHESRLDRLEVVQQWLAERGRAREKGGQL
jgi:hypothetical protein